MKSDIFEEVTEVPERKAKQGTINWNKFFTELGKAIVKTCIKNGKPAIQITEKAFIENFCNGKPSNVITSIRYQLQKYNFNFKDEKRAKYYEKRYKENIDKINRVIKSECEKRKLEAKQVKGFSISQRKDKEGRKIIFSPIF